MTRQINDLVYFGDKEYELTGADPIDVFNPEAYGITPHGVSTACYRGFACVYRIRDNVLHLERLGISSENRRYPAINGRKSARERSDSPTSWCGGRAYTFPEFRLRFSGTMRIARGHAETSVGMENMGFADDTEYEQVLDLDLDHGVVVASRDLSTKFARIRLQHTIVKGMMDSGLLTGAELGELYSRHGLPRTIAIENSFDFALRGADPDQLGAMIEEIERRIRTPRHLVAVLGTIYDRAHNVSHVLTLEHFARMRVPERQLRGLRELVQGGSDEKATLACFLQRLLASPAGREAPDMLRYVVSRTAQELPLSEPAQMAVDAMLAGVTAESWP